MTDGWLHDLAAMIQQGSMEQVQDMELHLTGRLIEYDPVSGMGRAVLDTRRAEDSQGNTQVMETGWMQIGSGHVGNGSGDQYFPEGGATATNQSGELVQVAIQNRQSGLAVVANMCYSDQQKPPGAGVNGQAGNSSQANATDDTAGTIQLRATERIIKFPAGTFLKFYANGDIGVYAAQDLVMQTQRDCKLIIIQGDLTVDVQQGDANVTVDQGNVDISAPLGDIIIESGSGSIAATTDSGDIAVEAAAGAIDIYGSATVQVSSDVEIDVTAPVVNILSAIVNIGTGLQQVLCNFNFFEWAATHTHPTAVGTSGTPTIGPVLGIDTTANTTAS